MLALLLAASLAQAQPAARETPNLHREEPAACKALRRHVLERARPGPLGEPAYDGRSVRKLGELPPADREYAVLRKLGGCTVPAPVGYRQDYLAPGPADARP
jgi:hypothetical protein